jgi:O-methyltransferase domain/Dimerisation domain
MTDTTSMDTAAAGATLTTMLHQHQASHALVVAAQLGLADLLAEGPRSAEDLAGATNTQPRSLYRLLRALTGMGVFAEEDGRFRMTPLAEPLRAGVSGSVSSMAQYLAVEMRAWHELLYSVQTGASAWERALGVGHYEYFARDPEANTHFNEVMTAGTRRALPDILDAYDFSRIDTLVDLGGGRGLLLAGILQRYPDMDGVLLDLPHVVAEAPAVLEEAGVADRCRIVGGDFQTDLPSGCDAYVLKNVVLGMSDLESVGVFRACHGAMAGHGRLLVIGGLIGTGPAASAAAQGDLTMLVIFGQAGVRTEEEMRSLLTDSGFHVTRVIPAGRAGAVVEAVPL